MNAPASALLEVDGLKTYFFTRDGVVRAVDGVSFTVYPGETLAVVGESGCGKSVMSLSILRLIASPPGRVVAGRLIFEGRDLLSLPEPEMRKVRGNEIAMALACNPRLLIADEPTTALDVTIQAQILDLLEKLRHDLRVSILLITHDLAVVAETAQRVVVMYAGQVVEMATVLDLFRQPLHPYTHALLASVPVPGAASAEPLRAIPGAVPDLRRLPPGCRFAPRCPRAFERCRSEAVPTYDRPGRSVRCFLYAGAAA